MKFGVREIANVVFRAKSAVKIGNTTFQAGQPVLYIDSAKTSTLEGAGTTVYATGGRGNTRLIAWEGEKTLTFTVEDALLSPVGMSVLTGAGLLGGNSNATGNVHVHVTSIASVGVDGKIDLTDALGANDKICETAPLFVLGVEKDGSLNGYVYKNTEVQIGTDGKTLQLTTSSVANPVTSVMVDFYVLRNASKVTEMQIDAENFAGYYYVEADTLFRRQDTGVDMPANITLPNVKIQSNFTFSMASSGDPSTFTFTMDAFPGYTYFNKTKKVLCVIQIIEEDATELPDLVTVMGEGESNFPNDSEPVKPTPPPADDPDDGEDPDTGDGN